MEDSIIKYIQSEKFKINDLLKHYHIICQLTLSDEEYNQQNILDISSIKLPFLREIFTTLLQILKFAVKQYMKALKKNDIPSHQFISQGLQVFIDQQFLLWTKNENLNEITDIFQQQVYIDSTTFLLSIIKTQDIYITFFRNNLFDKVEKLNFVEAKINLFHFVKDLKVILLKQISSTLNVYPNSTYKILLKEIDSQLQDLIILMNNKLIKIYESCQEAIKQEIETLKIQTNECKILNKYFIQSLIEELAGRAYDTVENQLSYTYFCNSEKNQISEICYYIVHNFDLVDLISDATDDQSKNVLLQQPFEVNDILKNLIKPEIKISTHYVMRKKDRKIGLLIETQSLDCPDFVLHKEHKKLVITNAQLISNRWTFIKILSDNSIISQNRDLSTNYQSIEEVISASQFLEDINDLIEEDSDNEEVDFDEEINGLASTAQTAEIQNSMLPKNQRIISKKITGGAIMVSAAGDIGAALGTCLANINNYDSKKEFLADFCQQAYISGSINIILMKLPILGRLIALGGLGYFSLKIVSSKQFSKKSKKKQLNRLMIETGTGIGTSVGGAIIGSALIPIPILGGFIGGFIGGIIGGTSTAVYFDFLDDLQLQELIDYLEQKQVQGHWEDLDLLNLIGISEEFFFEQCPAALKFDPQKNVKWLNLVQIKQIKSIINYQVIFTIISIYYTQKERETKEKMKASKKELKQKAKEYKQKNQEEIIQDLELKLLKIQNQKSIETEYQQVESDSSSDSEEEYNQGWPPSIEQFSKWLIQEKIHFCSSLKNLETIMSNLIKMK